MPVSNNGGSRRCRASTHRNVFSVTPLSKVKLVAAMLKAIYVQEDKAGASKKARAVVEKLIMPCGSADLYAKRDDCAKNG